MIISCKPLIPHAFSLLHQDDTEWAYTDSRRLGRIKLIDAEDIFSVPPLSLLGMDPYLNMPTVEHVQTKLAARTAPIKAILLDQNAIFAGLGNWLVDEILYHAKIHPAQPCNSLSWVDYPYLPPVTLITSWSVPSK